GEDVGVETAKPAVPLPVAAQRVESVAPAAGAAVEDAVPAPAEHVKAADWDKDAVVEDEEGEDAEERGRKRKGKRLVMDPKTGRLEARHDRKGSRSRPAWEDEVGRWSEEELEDALGFTEYDFLTEDDETDDSET
ncbi:MAG: hypothetical protein DYG90_09970, partial [Chloroflexi bacterium CFX6]|nr:hypothetical protein [Chloroflexi bacterium CFX6]